MCLALDCAYMFANRAHSSLTSARQESESIAVALALVGEANRKW